MSTKLAITITKEQAKSIHEAMDSEHSMLLGIKSAISSMNKAGSVLHEIKKQLQHGQWLDWLKQNKPNAVDSDEAWIVRAQRWMKISTVISECKNPELLDRAQSVRQLLQLAGAIPDGETTQALPQMSEATPTVLISKFTRFFSGITPSITPEIINSWPEADRKNFRETLKPAAEMYYLLE